MPVASFYIPWKHQKTWVFLKFSGGSKLKHFHEMGYWLIAFSYFYILFVFLLLHTICIFTSTYYLYFYFYIPFIFLLLRTVLYFYFYILFVFLFLRTVLHFYFYILFVFLLLHTICIFTSTYYLYFDFHILFVFSLLRTVCVFILHKLLLFATSIQYLIWLITYLVEQNCSKNLPLPPPKKNPSDPTNAAPSICLFLKI